MPVIDINDFWTQTLAALVAGIALLFAQPGWIRRPDPVQGSSTPKAGHSNNGGNQAIFEGTKTKGDLSVDQRYIDKSQTTNITNNVNNASGATASDDDLGKIILVGIAGVVAAALFLIFRPLLQGFVYGTIPAILIMLGVAIARTHRLKAWTARAVVTIAVVLGTVAVTFLTWTSIGTLERDGLSLDAIAAAIPPTTPEQDARGIGGSIDHFTHAVIPVFFNGERPVLMFVLLLVLSAAASVALITYAWLLLLNWHAFLRFARSDQQKPRIVTRAKSFTGGRGIGVVAGAAIIATIAIGTAQGGAYDLWQGFQNQQQAAISQLGTEGTPRPGGSHATNTFITRRGGESHFGGTTPDGPCELAPRLVVDEVLLRRLVHGSPRIPTERPRSAVGAADLSSIFFTGGSTGEPKGTISTHSANSAGFAETLACSSVGE